MAILPSILWVLPIWTAAPSPPRAEQSEQQHEQQTDRRSRDLPWEIGRTHRYTWRRSGKTVGETTFRFERREEVSGTVYRLSTHRRLEQGGQIQQATGELYLTHRAVPLRYREEITLQSGKGYGGRQNLEVEVAGGKARLTYINNDNTETASRHEVPVPARFHLFVAPAIEHWVAFCPQLQGARERTLKILYPHFAAVLDMTFTRSEREETVEIGGKPRPAIRYRFELKQHRYEGSVWIDEQGRLLRYESEGLEVLLEPPAADAPRAGEITPRSADGQTRPQDPGRGS